MSQKPLTFNFEWVEDISHFTEVFIKNYDEKNEKAKGTNKCVVKKKFKIQYYKNSVKESQTLNIINYLKR